jgi:type IX secretion system PorP/SprF family membrane protein
MGYGVTVYDDVTGPISRMELNGSYAYNIALSAEIRMSFGANFGVLQYKIDGSKLTTTTTPDEQTTYDAIIPNGVWSKFFPDAAAGVYVYRNDFHIGLSADNLFNQTILNNQPINGQSKALGKLQSNFYLLGSYYYIINRHYAVESSGMIQKVIPAPYQFDINVKGIYMNTAWLGISYRSQDAISILMGYTFNKRILVGYSFDWSLSAISRYNIGTHEIMLAYKFNPLK